MKQWVHFRGGGFDLVSSNMVNASYKFFFSRIGMLLMIIVMAAGVMLIDTAPAVAVVYAEDVEDEEDYDYTEIYDDDDEEVPDTGTTEPAEAQPAAAQPALAPSVPVTTNPPHIKDSTPRTADFAVSNEFLLSGALLLLGVALLLISRRGKGQRN